MGNPSTLFNSQFINFYDQNGTKISGSQLGNQLNNLAGASGNSPITAATVSKAIATLTKDASTASSGQLGYDKQDIADLKGAQGLFGVGGASSFQAGPTGFIALDSKGNPISGNQSFNTMINTENISAGLDDKGGDGTINTDGGNLENAVSGYKAGTSGINALVVLNDLCDYNKRYDYDGGASVIASDTRDDVFNVLTSRSGAPSLVNTVINEANAASGLKSDPTLTQDTANLNSAVSGYEAGNSGITAGDVETDIYKYSTQYTKDGGSSQNTYCVSNAIFHEAGISGSPLTALYPQSVQEPQRTFSPVGDPSGS